MFKYWLVDYVDVLFSQSFKIVHQISPPAAAFRILTHFKMGAWIAQTV